MKTKTKITLVIIAFLLLTIGAVLCILHNQGFFFDKSPIYGTFEYKNEDGSIEKVVLTESTVYCENVDFEGAMRNAAYYTVMDDLEKDNKKDTDIHDIIALEDKYIEQWDFESAFQGKVLNFDDTYYYEDELGHLYVYEIYYPETGSYGLDLYVSLDDKTLSIADKTFKYIEK